MKNFSIDREVESLGALVSIMDRAAPAGSVMVCSGGVATDPDAPPLLCLTRDLAIEQWVMSFTEWIWENQVKLNLAIGTSCIRWAEYPGVYRYAITMQHEAGHRISDERFAVICRAWIGTEKDALSLPAEKPTIDEGHER